MDLLIKPVWQMERSDANQTTAEPDVDTVLDDATLSTLCIRVNDVLISEMIDEEQQRHDGPSVSAYRFAEWLVWNWWRLRWEPLHTEPSDVSWRQAHETASIGGGWLWPRITFASDGETVSVYSSGSVATVTEPITYTTDDAERFVSADTFATGIDSFVIDVIDRLKRESLARNSLFEMWRELQNEREDTKLTLYRRLEALLGSNPDEGDPTVIRQLTKDREVLGENATDELAAEMSLSSQAPFSARGLIDLARQSGIEVKDDNVAAALLSDYPPAMIKADPSGLLIPSKIGQEAAQSLRTSERLGDGRITNPLLSDLCGLPKQALTKTSKANPPIAYSWTSENSKHVVLKARTTEGRRFDAARLLADKLLVQNGESMQPATSTYMFRQKMQRAFAAELLCPYEVLLERLEGDYSEDSMEAVAKHFMVSPLVVASTLENNGIFAHHGSKYEHARSLQMESSSLDKANDESASSMNKRVLSPNPTTVAAIEAARRGEVVEIGSPEDAIEELNRDD